MTQITDNALIRAAFTEFRSECLGHDDKAVDIIDAALDGDEGAAVEVLGMLGEARAANPNNPMHTERLGGVFCVRDVMTRAVWWPSEDIADIIGDARSVILAVCCIAPMLGTWHD